MPAPQQAPEKAAEQAKAPQTLMEAILAVQGELPKVHKDAANPHFKSKYVSLDALMDAILPVLNKNGLVWITLPQVGGHLTYRLVHASSGQEVCDTIDLLAAKDDPQGQGAAITYARRYALTAVLGITADEDDDGNRAADARRASQQRQSEIRRASMVLSDEQRTSMLNALREAGLDVAETMAKVGIDPDAQITAAQAHQVRALIEEREAKIEEARGE